MSALLTLRGIEKSFHGKKLLDGVELDVHPEERVALVGANGSGKSTLLRIAAGAEEPEAGARVLKRMLVLSHLEQEPNLDPSLSALEIVLSSPVRGLEVHAAEALLDVLGITDPSQKLGNLSGGEARRVAIARALAGEPELVLLDEPTNHLDAFVIERVEAHLAGTRAALLFVTHDRYVLERVATRVVELDRGHLYESVGGYAEHLAARAARLETESNDAAARAGTLRRETVWMRRGAPARTTKQKARISRYDALVAAAPQGVSRELELEIPPGPRLGSKVIEVTRASARVGGREILAPFDLSIGAGERVGIVGRNGSGKTTLMRLLCGQSQPASGVVVIGDTVRLAIADQSRSTLDPAKTVIEEVAGSSDQVFFGERVVRAEAFLDRFLFPGAMKHALVGRLSGGERARLCVAKLLLEGANVIALDEPTNDLDLPTLRALEEALVDFPGTLLAVSHDRWFLDRVSTRVLYVDGAGGVRAHPGDASDLLESLAREREAQSERASPARAPERTNAPVRKKGLSSWQQREYDELFEKIASLEDVLASHDARLADPALYAKGREEIERARRERDAAAETLKGVTARWEELEALR